MFLFSVSILGKAVDKANFINDAIQTIQSEDTLIDRWKAMFQDDDQSKEIRVLYRSAWGKFIIAKRLWACYMEKALKNCTTLLF